MKSHRDLVLTAILLVPLGHAHGQKGYAWCEQRDPSVSLEECKARIAMADVAPLTECKGRQGEEYRQCAVKVPSRITPPPASVPKDPYAGLTEQQKADATLCARMHAIGGTCPEEREAQMAKIQKSIDDANAAIHDADREEEKQVACVGALHVGDGEKKVLACSLPQQINGDLVDGTEQWIYPRRNYVYVRKGIVRNVQWSTD